jgi:polyhydroxyalkanoate synthesis regulator phasin
MYRERRGFVSNENIDKTFAMLENSTEKIWDMWLVTLGSMSWTQEQIENMGRKYLEQRQVAREEANKVIEELTNQAKKNQQQMQKMIQEAVANAFDNLEIPTFTYIDELSKKVDELSKKVDNL